MKKYLIFILLLIIPINIYAEPTSKISEDIPVNVDTSKKVYDYAKLYTDDEKSKLSSLISEFTNKYNLDLAVVTVDSTNGKSYISYADDFYDYNGFKSDGLLFLVDMNDRIIYISTKGSAITSISNTDCDAVTEAIYTSFSNRNYYKGTSNMIKYLKYYYNHDSRTGSYSSDMLLKYFILIIIPLIISIAVIIILINSNKLVRTPSNAASYIDKNTLILNTTKDLLVNTRVVRHLKESSSSSSGGSHTSSSGSSHGGGGHSF